MGEQRWHKAVANQESALSASAGLSHHSRSLQTDGQQKATLLVFLPVPSHRELLDDRVSSLACEQQPGIWVS